MYTVGIDEAGRGPWAGPLVAAAVLLPSDFEHELIKDSKKLTKNNRGLALEIIKRQAGGVGIGFVPSSLLDQIGLQATNALAMQKAIDQLNYIINTKINYIINYVIDGSINYLPTLENCKAVIRADSTVPAVAAASIVAKTFRDNYMASAAKLYPNHQFELHAGYGTKGHLAAMEQFGLTPLHRLSFRPVAELL